MKRLFLRSTFTPGSTLSAESESSGYETGNSMSTSSASYHGDPVGKRAAWRAPSARLRKRSWPLAS